MNLKTSNSHASSHYYDWERTDAIDFLLKNVGDSNLIKNVLELGCGTAKTASLLMKSLPIKSYKGIEKKTNAAEKAGEILTQVVMADFEDMIKTKDYQGLNNDRYDLIVLLDVLEHLIDPWTAMNILTSWLNEGGYVLCSIPNAGNYYVLKKLFLNRFDYEDRGILDKTHLRFFTFSTINNLFNQCGLTIEKRTTNSDLYILKLKIFNILTFGVFNKQFVRQFILIARKAAH